MRRRRVQQLPPPLPSVSSLINQAILKLLQTPQIPQLIYSALSGIFLFFPSSRLLRFSRRASAVTPALSDIHPPPPSHLHYVSPSFLLPLLPSPCRRFCVADRRSFDPARLAPRRVTAVISGAERHLPAPPVTASHQVGNTYAERR